MNNKSTLSSAICFGALLVSNPSDAGLSLSDAPLFVTEVLAPNVILSPAYKWNANEVSLMDIPWDTYVACGDGVLRPNRALCPKVNSLLTHPNDPDPGYVLRTNNDEFPWLEDTYSPVFKGHFQWAYSSAFYRGGAWRVTPWPGMDICNDNLLFTCTDIQLYPDDGAYGGMTDSDGIGFRYEEPYGPKYRGGDRYLHPGRENYLRSQPGVALYEPGRVRYSRSDRNFLYYREDMKSNYKPWPSLGSHEFNAYSVADAARPLYNPLIAASPPRATLGTGQTTRFTDIDASGWVDDAFIGKYWTYNGTGDVWKASSYTESSYNSSNIIQFAHWFTYWRSSYLASRGMLGTVLSELNDRKLINRFRIGLNYKNSAGVRKVGLLATDGNDVSGRIADFADIIYNYSADFTQWDHAATLEYFKRSGAYKDVPDASVAEWTGVRACRRNYEIILAPDYTWLTNELGGNPAIGTVSNVWESAMGSPYANRSGNQWGDVGAIGWKQDLAPRLQDNLLPGKQNEATWQHLVRYVIAPKASGFIFPSSVADYDSALSILKANPAHTWPSSSLIGKKAIDDIWHMVLNSRGMFYPSESINGAIENLLQAFNDILVRNVSGSALATNTSSLREGGQVYQAAVESDWKGHLRSFNVVQDASNASVLNVDIANPLWDLAQSVSGVSWNNRKIATYSGRSGVAFRWDTIGGGVQSLLKQNPPDGVSVADTYGQKVLEYLRGSGECEEGSGNACVAGGSFVFRRRNLDSSNRNPYTMIGNPNGRNVLGDIANSSPWLTPAPPAGLSDVDFPGYNQHRIAKASRSRVLYVGANDGMLHAVKADGNGAGSELFAYIPSFVQPNLSHLSRVGYSHKFYVDGSPFSSEVDVSGDGRGWKTVLAGGGNKGGKGYYLLDVSNPDSNTEANSGNWVLWEFTNNDDVDMHYTYNMPVDDGNGHAAQLARMNNGKWALIVGNGYPEDSGKKACLFIIPVAGPGEGGVWDEGTGGTAGVDHFGSEYVKICAGNIGYSADGGIDTNGLSTPRPFDANGDGKIDYIYAGDLNGNLWRFDVTSTTVGNWGVAYNGAPVFVAKNSSGQRQSIISPPAVVPHSVKEADGRGGVTQRTGYLVLFGTGKYLENSDRVSTSKQSFYSVWDRGFSNINRANLFEQTLVAGTRTRTQSAGAKPQPVYCTAAALDACGNNPNVVSATNRHLGWYWDMPTSGERLTGKFNVINGVALFNTFFPAPDTYTDANGVTQVRMINGVPQLDPCQYGGDGWLMGLNAVYGYMEDRFSIFDINQDGVVNNSDSVAAGVKVGAAIGGTTFATGTGTTKIGIYSPTNLGTHASEGRNMRAVINVGESSGRVSWYELLD
ncbi:MAG: PilC/PilY family type IV pilus protein [Pseudomonadota bacterium]|nr:PilC/PilY family type IV pilus protein [Pseudomonadota bacterium]MDP1902845.1 PilC/PilY family type IV pilus protein [Pseudomonadota bacterium]MDP2352841.1 PilC/PilY family type IV pilus protein [Pseudomonadota bacterium]